MMRAVNTALETTVEALPNVGAGLDTHAGPTFVQARLALLGKTVFLLSFGFFVAINGLCSRAASPVCPLSDAGSTTSCTSRLLRDGGRVGGHAAAAVVAAQRSASSTPAASSWPGVAGADGRAAAPRTAHGRAVRADGDDDGARRAHSVDREAHVRPVGAGAVPLHIAALMFHTGSTDPHAPASDFLRIVPPVNTLLWS